MKVKEEEMGKVVEGKKDSGGGADGHLSPTKIKGKRVKGSGKKSGGRQGGGPKKKKSKKEVGVEAGGGEEVVDLPMGAYYSREMFLIKMEEDGEMEFKYVKNDGTPDNLKWWGVGGDYKALSIN